MIQVAMLYAPGMLATALHLCGRDGELYDFRGRPEMMVPWPAYLAERMVI